MTVVRGNGILVSPTNRVPLGRTIILADAVVEDIRFRSVFRYITINTEPPLPVQDGVRQLMLSQDGGEWTFNIYYDHDDEAPGWRTCPDIAGDHAWWRANGE